MLRRALSLLEVLISSAILIGIAGLATSSLASGSSLQRTVAARTEADNSVAALVTALSKELRSADINKIYIDATDYKLLGGSSGSDYYSFKITTGFKTSGINTLDQVVTYGKGIILRFSPSASDATKGALWRQEVTFDSTGTATASTDWRLMSDQLAWTYTETGSSDLLKGFQIQEYLADASSGTVTGNSLVISAAGRPSNVAVTTGETGLPEPSQLLKASSKVFLRSTMFDGYGVTKPTITSATTAAGSQGASFRYDITATNYPTSFSALGLPAGLSVNNATGVISGKPTQTGVGTITLGAANSAGSDTETLTISIGGPVPAISSPVNASGTVGRDFSYVIEATNTPLSYSATNLPAGLSYVSGTHAITGVPTVAGTTLTTLTATNANGTGTGTLTITIGEAPITEPPVITSPTTATGSVTTDLLYQIQATNSPTTFYASALPSGITFDSVTGIISGRPTSAGVTTSYIYARNDIGVGNATLTFTVASAPVPVITSSVSLSGSATNTITYIITATNNPTSYSTTNLPVWMTGPTSAGVITGTPTNSHAGNGTFTISATNAYGTGSATVSYDIASQPVPAITSTTSASAVANTTFSYTITASASPTSYAASGLPTGLAISTSSGLISGTPTTVGSSSITISASNAAGTGTATLNLTVTANSSDPSITLGNDTGTGTFKVLGTIAPSSVTGKNLRTNTFASTLPSGYSIARGWIRSEQGSMTSTQFTITGPKPTGAITLGASIEDVGGRTGSVSRTY